MGRTVGGSQLGNHHVSIHIMNQWPFGYHQTEKRVNYIFGRLDISVDPFLTLCKHATDCHSPAESTNVGIHPAHLNALDQIRLTIQRTDLEIRRIPIPYDKKRLSRVTEVSKKTLKGGAISSIIG